MLLRSAVGMAAPQATVPALGAAELVGAALEAFATDPDLLAAERARIKLLLVDDAQHLDPQAARLVRVLAAGAELTVLAGDPNQAVFGYRGADPVAVARRRARDHPDRVAPLRARRRTSHHRHRAAAAWRRRGTRHQRCDDDRAGSLTVRIAASPHAESALIADALRRAHLVDGVPWSQMAVIVRSVPRLGAALARALVPAGVPVDPPAPNAPLADQPAVRALLTVLDATAHGLDGDRALALLTGPIGRVDPVSLRQLRRALRRADGSQPPREFADLLVEALERTQPKRCPPISGRPLRRVARCSAAARGSAADGQDPRYALWQAWHHSRPAAALAGSQRARRPRRARRPTGTSTPSPHCSTSPSSTWHGPRAHRCAASSTTCESMAAARGAPRPTTGARRGRHRSARMRRSAANGSSSSSPACRKACGPTRFRVAACWAPSSWSMCWTASSRRPTAGLSSRAPLLAEERRLLIAAMGRARTPPAGHRGRQRQRRRVDACRRRSATSWRPWPPIPTRTRPNRSTRRGCWRPPALVGRLRAVVCAARTRSMMRAGLRGNATGAAGQAGVAGADPAQWYGMTPLSTDEPLWTGDDHVVTLSPSTLQTLTDCPLRWLLERHGGTDGRDVRSAVGSLMHALVAESG